MEDSISVFAQFILGYGTDDDIKRMPCTSLITGSTEDCSYIVGDAIQASWDKFAGIAQIDQFGVSDIALMAYRQSNVSFEFSEEHLQGSKRNEFLHKVLFVKKFHNFFFCGDGRHFSTAWDLRILEEVHNFVF